MAEVVLFHFALGGRPGAKDAADRLRAAGHKVHAPDYYDGEVFDDPDEGLRKRDELGYAEIAQRAREAVAAVPAGLVFAGFSLEVLPAELLAATTPGTRGAVLMHAAIPVEDFGGFGVERWPAGVPVQMHYAAEDPWAEAGAAFEEHAYPGSGHLFADPDLPGYDRASSEAMWRRVLAFLDRVEGWVSRG